MYLHFWTLFFLTKIPPTPKAMIPGTFLKFSEKCILALSFFSKINPQEFLGTELLWVLGVWSFLVDDLSLKRSAGFMARYLCMPPKTTGWWFQNIFYFQPHLGRFPFLTDISQMGWNHQLEKDGSCDSIATWKGWVFIAVFLRTLHALDGSSLWLLGNVGRIWSCKNGDYSGQFATAIHRRERSPPKLRV